MMQGVSLYNGCLVISSGLLEGGRWVTGMVTRRRRTQEIYWLDLIVQRSSEEDEEGLAGLVC